MVTIIMSMTTVKKLFALVFWIISQSSAQDCDTVTNIERHNQYHFVNDSLRDCFQCKTADGNIVATTTWDIWPDRSRSQVQNYADDSDPVFKVINGILVIGNASGRIQPGFVNRYVIECYGHNVLRYETDIQSTAYADPFINTRRPNPYIVNEFDRVYLPCDSNYNNRIIISGGIVFVDAITRDVVVRSSSIYFGRVSRSMGRVYRCRTEFPNGMMLFSSPFNLTVQFASEISTSERMISIRIGGTLMASCDYEGVPPSTVQWMYNGSILDDSIFPRLSLSFNGSRTELTLMRTSHPDVIDSYTCMASNHIGSENTTIHVEILPLLTLYYLRTSIADMVTTREQVEVVAALDLEGQAVYHSFECLSFYGGNNLVWERENGTQRFPTYPVTDGQLLNMSADSVSVEISDLGIYTCRDTVRGEEISINITGGPLGLQPKIPHYIVPDGGNASLKVYTAGNPPVTPDEITWYDFNGNMITSGENLTLLEDNTRLIIRNLDVYDNGYYEVVISRPSHPANITTNIRLEILVDCLSPLPLLRNASSLEDLMNTTTNSTWAIQCQNGYTPIDPLNITCRYSNYNYGWDPDPSSLCIELEASLSLIFIQRNNSRPDIECPGDTISYNCSIVSNAIYLRLTWVVTFPGLSPITLTYGADSTLDVKDLLDMNISTTLTEFRASEYIESVIELTVFRGIEMNTTLLECSIAGYGSVSEEISFNTSVPNTPLNFISMQEHNMILWTTVTLQWERPHGIGTESIVDSYFITVTPPLMMGPSRITIYYSPYNMTFTHNVEYNVSIIAVNCAGESISHTLPIAFIGCGHPSPPTNGSLGSYQTTIQGTDVTFQCDAELVPSAVMTTTCTNKSRWIPPPEEQDCDIVEGSVTISIHEQNISRPDINCPGDTFSYNCTITSNSETIHHLTWRVTYPGHKSINITYNGSSSLNSVDLFDMQIRAVMTAYRAYEYIESIITVKVLGNITDEVKLECIIEGLANDSVTFVNSSAPLPPTDFRITGKYDSSLATNISLQWNPPHGNGTETIVDRYIISISPTPLSDLPNEDNSVALNVTLRYNLEYNISLVSINCAGVSSPQLLQGIKYVDCYAPIPPTNGSVVSFTGTKVGDNVTYKCDEGFRPSLEMNGTCTLEGLWSPAPQEHNCTFIKGFVMLTLSSRNTSQPDIDCPGDTLSYNCSIQSNSESVHLTWHVTLPGFGPVNITYDSNSMLNSPSLLTMNTTVYLSNYIADSYIESSSLFKVPKGFSLNGTKLECSINDLDNDTVTLFVNTSVPLPPINFNITREYHTVSNVTVTFEWDPPQGYGPEVIVDGYEIIIVPSPLSHPTSNTVTSTIWNVTLDFNIQYNATITSINCAGMGMSFMLQSIEFLDCGIPLPPGNGSIVSYSGTKVGNNVIYKCHDGFRPSHEMSGTCTMDSMWQPVPEQQTCTLIKANVSLLLLERNENSTLIDCPGDTIFYNCSVFSNSEMVHLTWHVTFPGLTPMNITYGNNSVINVPDHLDMNITTTLIRYEADQYIESVIMFTLLKNVTMNGTLLECSVAPSLDSDFMFVLVNTSVPFPPINFNITRELHRVSNITVTFEWDPPQVSGPAVIINSYEITIMPTPLSHPISNVIYTLSWNMTVNYNVEYTATITAENCAGVSIPFTLHSIEFLDCGIPIPPTDGTIVSYSGTKLGNIVTFKCDEGFRPSAEVNGTCGSDARWNPAPNRHNCTFVEASVNLHLLERNEMSTVIDCPGDTIIYNCSILSNSEMVHLTWHVTFPGVMPINITYDSTSSINVMDTLDRNTSVILLQYEADQYIESVITFRLLKNISMNGTILLECGIAPHLGNDTAAIIVNTSVPLPPTNFSIAREYHEVLNITVTLEWVPPQGSGPSIIVDTYEITVTPEPLSGPVSNIISATSWNVTLNYNLIYTAVIAAENCAGVSSSVTLGNIEFLDCGIPRPPINGNIVQYIGTKVGDIVTYRCNGGYRPSAEMNGTCTMDSMWDPAPERHNCTFITASVSLSRLGRNRNSTVIDCPEDNIIYNCSIQSNSEMIHLTWYITFPGHVPINITYYDNSSTMDVLDLNTSVILTQYRADQYIESVITITLLKNVTMNGTISLECGIAPYLGNDSASIPVNTAVPNPPTNFSISREYHKVHNITIILEWIPPQGSGPNTIVDAYKVTIMPKPLSSPVSNIVRVTSWNVTLSYNSIYTAMIIAENCAGVSVPVTLGNIEFLDCGIPGPPMNGSIVNFSGTKVGDIVTYKCNEGYRPSAEMNGTCGMNSLWDPVPERHNCTLVTASVAVSLLERNEISLDIDCPGDTIIYNCSILSNSETVHLTWGINFPGLIPINLTFDGNSVPNNAVYLDFNVSVTLTEYRSDRYIESIIILTLLKNFSMNGTLVKCSIDPDLDSSSVIVPVNTSVPLAPSNFNIVERYDEVLNTTVAFEWDPPQGSGPERVVNNYTISITPRPVSHPIVSVVTSRFLNVTLNYNVEYTATVIAENCAGISSETVIRDIEYLDCGNPLSPINGSVLHYSGTKPGDYVTYKCNEGFRPSPAMNATCMSSDSRWSPLPERHNCTFVQASVILILSERIEAQTNIDCPGDNVSYICMIQSNSERVHLVWKITFPELMPVNITYDDTSVLNSEDQLVMNVTSTLINYRADQFIESVLVFTLLKNVTMNGTKLECSIDPNLNDAMMILSVNTSVPLMPTGFNTSVKYDNSLDTIVIFLWDPPQGSGPEAVVDSYKISITPRPVSHPVLNVVSYTTSWNVTLYFNVEYSATIIAVNCEGDSSPFTLYDIKYIDCYVPAPPMDGHIVNYSGTKVGDFVIFNCSKGFRPSRDVRGNCTQEGKWYPAPDQHNCTFVEAVVDLTLHERITQRSDIDCPGDTISYNCSVESNSETVELTWIITLPNEFAPINITYNSTSLLNQRDQLDIYVNSTLTEYTHDQYIETLITFTLFEDVDINGTELQCRSSDLDSVIVEVFANITVPLSPSGFHIIKEYDSLVTNITVTFGWDPPSGTGPEAVVDHYSISLSPDPLSHPGLSVVNSPPWNATLLYNTEYTAIIIAENCAGESEPTILSYFEFIDCSIPSPPTNGSLGNYTGSKVGDFITFQCNEGFTPSDVMTANCSMHGEWVPAPETHNCTLVEAFVTLSIIEKNSTYNDIDCPGDTILYNCSIESNSENIHLTWTIKFPGFVPIEITYNSTSIPGDVDYLDMNISVKLIDFMYQDIIQSTLLLTQLNKIPMNGTEVQCSIAPVLANDTVTVFINTSVPNAPTSFNFTNAYENEFNITVTFEWNPPEGSGPEVIIHGYEIIIVPKPVSYQSSSTIIYSTTWNVTLNYNVQYEATIIAVNCEGESSPVVLRDIEFINCGNPRSPTNGSLGNYSRTTKGAEVMFMCDLGFVPTSEVRAICNDTGSWDPAPERHHCTAEINCGDPIPPINGSLGNYSRTTKGAEVMFMCDLGFVPTSEVRAICNDTGSWDPALERHHCTAEINCGDPIPPINGSLGNYSRTTKGAEVMFMCDLGFVPTSKVRSICNDTGSWNPAPENHQCLLIEYLNTIIDITTLPTLLTALLIFIGILYAIVVTSLLMYLYSRRNKWQRKQDKIQDYIEEDISQGIIGLEFQINRLSSRLEATSSQNIDMLNLSIGDAEDISTLSAITSTRFTEFTSRNPSRSGSNETGGNIDMMTSSWGFLGRGRRVY